MSDTSRAIGATTLGGFKVIQEWGQSLKVTAVKEGDYATLQGLIPARGDVVGTFSDVAVNATVSKLEQLGGTGGRLTIEAESVLLQATYAAPLGPPQYEVDFEELTKKIEQHPCCGTLAVGYKHNWDDWPNMVDGDYIQRGDTGGGSYPPPSFWSGIPAWTLSQYQKIKGEGCDEYVVYYPVVIRTLQYLVKPTDVGDASGMQSNPPSESFTDISSWEWLQGSDSCVRKGNLYERTTKWTGGDRVLDLVYPTP